MKLRMKVPALVLIAQELMIDPAKPRHGYDLMKKTKLSSGALYTVLHQLEAAGWVARETEIVDTSAAKRPARKIYTLTDEGERAVRLELAEFRAQLRPSSWESARGEPKPAGGW
ncbi:PadR family transcriptional regulator [Streptomyces prunicolor]|uniref:PadR family transcriptional regulator n=1 Tax=Streptomyces prunicolor TaxID=67348 RepID=UPI002259314C|nr:PadR family transcriptional regulator [Streptomyces prunicolor]MCX5239811.1 PadR family transcriptional regulator [Streptomyces prunicolor]